MWATHRSRIWRGAMPGMERLGVGDLRRLQRLHVADRGDHDRRPQSRHQRNQARRETGLPRRSTLPCKPIWGAHDARHPNYNMSLFDPMWAVIQDCDIADNLPYRDRARPARGPQGRRRNYQLLAHALSPTIEPMPSLCASGVLERFPKLRFCADRVRHRLGAVGARSDGRGLPQASHVGLSEAQATAERVLPRAWRSVVPGRSDRAANSPGSTT